MRKRFKWKIIAFFAVMASLLLLGGCKFQASLDERREEYGLPVSVTYYTNGSGAYFGTSDTKKTLYLPEGAVAMNIGVDRVENGSIPTPTRNNYKLIGWYEAELDENGQVQTDENGEVILKAEAFDFQTRLQDGDEIVLYAKWQKNQAIYVYLVCDEITTDAPFVITENGQELTIENSGKLTEYNYQTDGIWYKSDLPKASGYTAYGLYEDEACTVEVAGTVHQAEKGDYTVYAKYIKGDWTILRTASDIKSKLFNAMAGTKNYYLANDIDCSSITVDDLARFTSTLQGNGYAIKNLTVNGGRVSGQEVTISAFGNVQSTAKIENVTFENVTLKCSLASKAMAKAFVLFSSLVDVTSISQVSLKGSIKVEIEERETNAIFTNMVSNDMWYSDNILFGGEGTDEEQINNGLDVDISEAQISVEMDNYEIEII